MLHLLSQPRHRRTRAVNSLMLGFAGLAVSLSMMVGMNAVSAQPASAETKCGTVDTSIIGGDICKGTSTDENNKDSSKNPIVAIITFVLQILTGAVGVAAVGAIIYGAILYSSAGGNSGQVEKAKTTISNTVIGIVVYAGMILILNFIIPGGVFGQNSVVGSGTVTSPDGGDGGDGSIPHNNVSGSGSASSPTAITYKTIANVKSCHTEQAIAASNTSIFLSCATDHVAGTPSSIREYTLAGKEVKRSGKYQYSLIGHANDMTYNSKTKTLLVNRWQLNGSNGKGLLLIDATNINKTKGTVTLSGKNSMNTANICYNAAADQYYANRIVYDGNFKAIKVLVTESKILKDIGQHMNTGQGTECNSSYVYIARADNSDKKHSSRVLVYNWSTKVIGVYKYTRGELEGVATANGKIYGIDGSHDDIIEITNMPV